MPTADRHTDRHTAPGDFSHADLSKSLSHTNRPTGHLSVSKNQSVFKKVLMDWSCRPRICRTYWKYKSWGSIIVLQTQKTYLFEDCTVILVHFALSLTSSCWFFFFVSSKSFFVSCMITLVFFSSEYLVRSCYFPPYVLPTDECVLKIWTPARSWSPWSMIRYAIFSPITITMIVIHGHKHQVINI